MPARKMPVKKSTKTGSAGRLRSPAHHLLRRVPGTAGKKTKQKPGNPKNPITKNTAGQHSKSKGSQKPKKRTKQTARKTSKNQFPILNEMCRRINFIINHGTKLQQVQSRDAYFLLNLFPHGTKKNLTIVGGKTWKNIKEWDEFERKVLNCSAIELTHITKSISRLRIALKNAHQYIYRETLSVDTPLKLVPAAGDVRHEFATFETVFKEYLNVVEGAVAKRKAVKRMKGKAK